MLTGDALFIGGARRPDLAASFGPSADRLAPLLYESLHTERVLAGGMDAWDGPVVRGARRWAMERQGRLAAWPPAASCWRPCSPASPGRRPSPPPRPSAADSLARH